MTPVAVDTRSNEIPSCVGALRERGGIYRRSESPREEGGGASRWHGDEGNR